MTAHYSLVFGFALVMLILNAVEVGRNDAANLVNAVFGARLLRRRNAVWLAGAAVILGATFSSPVIDTVRKGIFDPALLTHEAAIAVFMAVYIVNTVLLFVYSSFGMPVSTTASLVFALLGAAFAVGGVPIVHWGASGKVIAGIVCSIVLAGIAGFMIQRAVRGAIQDRTTHLPTLLNHGWWVGGGLLTGLCYFLVIKGMKQLSFVKYLQAELFDLVNPIIILLVLWACFALVIYALLRWFRERMARVLFPGLAVVGMLAMAFAFGQNDLANCAAPGLSAISVIHNLETPVGEISNAPLAWWKLFLCGTLIFAGMTTTGAQRVTRAEVNMGSMGDHVRLYAPGWCIGLARRLLRGRGDAPALAPPPTVTERGKTVHYDTLRASVIMSVSASVIATASGLKLPVSTTYVAFAAVVATGMADRIFQRGDAALKLGRSIWVVFCWFAAAALAVVASGLMCLLILKLGLAGLALGVVANLTVRVLADRRAAAQEERLLREAAERRKDESAGTVVPDDELD